MITLLSPAEPQRLLSAAGALDEADRALLDLWCVRGLADDRLATMSGVSAGRLRARRERIVARLAELEGLETADVGSALAQLAGTSPTGPAPDVPPLERAPALVEPGAVAPAPGLLLSPAAAGPAPRLLLGPAAPGLLLGAADAGPAPGLLLGPAAAALVALRPGLLLGPAAARLGTQSAPAPDAPLPDAPLPDAPLQDAPLQDAPALPPAGAVPASRSARRRHRRVIGGAVAALCLAIGVAAFASERAYARPASAYSLSAGALRAAQPVRAHSRTGMGRPGPMHRAAAHPGR